MLMQVSGCRRPMLIAVRGIQPGKRDPVQPPCGRCSGVGVRLQVSGPYEILQATVEIVRGSVHAEALGPCHRVHATACRGVPSCPLIAFNSCMVLGPTSPPEHSPPPRSLCGLLRLYPIGMVFCPLWPLLDRLGRFWRLRAGEQFSAEVVALPFGPFAPPVLLIHPFAQRTLRHFAAGTFGVELFAELSQLAGRAGALRGPSRL